VPLTAALKVGCLQQGDHTRHCLSKGQREKVRVTLSDRVSSMCPVSCQRFAAKIELEQATELLHVGGNSREMRAAGNMATIIVVAARCSL
jgi:hypothetical protein